MSGEQLVVESQLVLGRGDADVVIDDPEISRRHAVLRRAQRSDRDRGSRLAQRHLGQRAPDRLGGDARPGRRGSARPDDDRGRGFERRPSPSSLRARPLRRAEPTVPLEIPARGRALGRRVDPGGAAAPSAAPRCRARRASASTAASRIAAERPRARPRPGAPATLDCGPTPSTGRRRRRAAAGHRPLRRRRRLDRARRAPRRPHEVKALIGECVSRMARAVEQYGGIDRRLHGRRDRGVLRHAVGARGRPGAGRARGDPDPRGGDRVRARRRGGVGSRRLQRPRRHQQRPDRGRPRRRRRPAGGRARRRRRTSPPASSRPRRRARSSSAGSTARRLAHRFVLESLGEISVKGREQPVAAWRLVSVQEASQAPAPTPLVGREAEVDRLRGAGWTSWWRAAARSLLLVGETGIGKTRMLSELRTIAGDRAVWLEGHCRSYGGEILYGPFVDVLRRWLQVESGEAEVSVRTKLRAKLAGLPTLDADEVSPPLGRLLGFRVESDDAARDEAAGGAARASSAAPTAPGSTRSPRTQPRRARARRPALGRPARRASSRRRCSR